MSFCVTSPSLWSSYPLVSTHFHLVLLYFGLLRGFLCHITFVVVVLSFGDHSLPSCASVLRSPSCLSVSHHLRCGRPILWCPLTSILCFYTQVSFVAFCVTSPSLWSSYPLVSTHFHLVLLYSGLLRVFLCHITFVVVVLSFGVHHSLPSCASVLYPFGLLRASVLWFLCLCTSPSLWSSYPLVSTHFHLVLLYSGLLRSFCVTSPSLWSSYPFVSTHFHLVLLYSGLLRVFLCTSPSLWSSYPLVSTHFHLVLLYSGLLRGFLCHITFVVVVLSFGVHSLPSCASVLWSPSCLSVYITFVVVVLSFGVHSLPSCASVLRSPSWLSVSHHLRCGRPILWCPLTSILCFCTLVSFVSFCVHHLRCGRPILLCPLTSILCFCTLVSFVSFCVHHLRCGRPILWCPLTSILCFCTLVSFVAFCVTSPSLWSSYPLVSTHFHLVLLYSGLLRGFLCHITFVVVVLSFGVHSLPSCASILRSPSWLSVSHHLRCGRPILWCPLTSILCFCTLVSFVAFCVTSPSLWSSYPLVSTHFHLVLLYSGLLRGFLCHITFVVVILSFGVHSLPSCASVLWSPSWLSVSHHLHCGHTILWCPLTSILCFYTQVSFVSFCVHHLCCGRPILWCPLTSILCFCTLVSFVSFCVHHLRCGRPILWCPLTSILCFYTLVSFVSFCVHHLRCGRPILWCPLTSILCFCTLVSFVSFCVHHLRCGRPILWCPLTSILCFCTLVSFVSFCVHHLRCGRPILWCPLTSILCFCTLVSFVSFCVHHLRCGRPILWCPLTSILCFCTLVSFVSFCVTSPSLWSSYPVSHHLRCGRPILWCPLTSILCFCTQVSFVSFCVTSPSLWSSYPLVSTHFHLVLLYSGLLRVFLCYITFVVVVLFFGVHSLPSCASVLRSPSCLSHHLRCGRPILWCPLTSIFSLLHLLSFSPHTLTSSFVVSHPTVYS